MEFHVNIPNKIGFTVISTCITMKYVDISILYFTRTGRGGVTEQKRISSYEYMRYNNNHGINSDYYSVFH
jgi:hypothetical protein